MASRDSRSRRQNAARALPAQLSVAVDRIARGEQMLALIDPRLDEADTSYAEWLSARLTIAQLPQAMLPGCDRRCRAATHDPTQWVALADLALDPAHPRDPSRWQGWNDTLNERFAASSTWFGLVSSHTWFAGSPANPWTGVRLRAGTRLRRLTVTDPQFIHYDGAPQETLFRIEGGEHRGDALVAVTFGLSPLLPGLAGALIAPDHPPVRDQQVGVRMLAAGWSAVERGLPHER
jgi:hypothetical protein